MKKWIACALAVLILTACGNKKQLDSTKAYFSVVDYLKSQVKHMDSVPLNFTKITTVDSTSDTTSVTREEFHRFAKEFLDLPNIASAANMDDYKETNDFDEVLNNVLLMYTAKNADDEVRSETIMMQPDDAGNTEVRTILVTTMKSENGTTIAKNMTWHLDRRFQIVTKTNKPGSGEQIETVVISWE